jgi:hypothetical protein
MSAPRRQATIRGFFHALIAICGWALFVYWWYCVYPQISSRNAFLTLAIIGGAALATVLTTLIWIRYNIGIFRRKGPRRNPTIVAENHDVDFLGRKIEQSGPATLKEGSVIVISVEGDTKTYKASGV